jgi:hypothetical protein
MKKNFITTNNFLAKSFLVGLSITAAFFSLTFAIVPSKNYSNSFRVSPESAALTLANPSGSIKITTWDKSEIKLSAVSDDTVEISDHQQGSSVQVEIRCPKIGQSNFEINVPTNCSLDLKCLKGPIEISNAAGPISVQTTEGDILLNNLSSSNIVAKSTNGMITYSGTLSRKGIYNFSSVESTINISLPETTPFTLSATALPEKINLGGFKLTDLIPHERRVSGNHAGGGASLNIHTHRGQIKLNKLLKK